MANLRVRDLIDLVTAGVDDADGRIQKMYEWHVEQRTTSAKFFLGASGTLLAALAVAFMKAELKIPWWQTALGLLGALGTGAVGIWRFYRLRLISREFVATLFLFSELRQLAPFFRTYRATVRR